MCICQLSMLLLCLSLNRCGTLQLPVVIYEKHWYLVLITLQIIFKFLSFFVKAHKERESTRDDFDELLHFFDDFGNWSGLLPPSEEFNQQVDSTFKAASQSSSTKLWGKSSVSETSSCFPKSWTRSWGCWCLVLNIVCSHLIRPPSAQWENLQERHSLKVYKQVQSFSHWWKKKADTKTCL